jgi:hypothetical protein
MIKISNIVHTPKCIGNDFGIKVHYLYSIKEEKYGGNQFIRKVKE